MCVYLALVMFPSANWILRRRDYSKFTNVYVNGPKDRGSIPGRVIPKTQKMVLDASFLNTQYYNVRVKGKVEQSRELSSTLPYTSI